MEKKFVNKEQIVSGLKSLGIKRSDNIFVHCSMKKFGFVCGGAQIIIEALIEVIGEDGNILMPTQSWKNLDPSAGVHWEEPEEWWQAIRDNWPAYDSRITPTNTMGSVAEMFRNWPETKRSNHPARSIAALGKDSEYFVENHDLSNIFGIESPLHRFYKKNGKVLLLGVGYDKNTSLHLADELANYPSKHYITESSAIIKNGKREWIQYETLFVDGEDFEEIGQNFEKVSKSLKSKDIGNATVKVMEQRELVDFAIKWIERNRV